jgi:hypothetical protein
MNDLEIKIATNIKTEVFYDIVNFLKNNGWKLTIEYDENIFDKAIDFDLYQFTKNGETILLAWDNWFEGEIKSSIKNLEEMARLFQFTLKFGQPEYLHKPNIIDEKKSLLKFKK